MKRFIRFSLVISALIFISATAVDVNTDSNWTNVAKIREEGFQRSQIKDIISYMTDVLGARLTLSEDMKRAQTWAVEKMKLIGLVNTKIEPFMDYGVSWDNEYCSLHMMEPDYQPMVGFPLTHTPGSNGKVRSRVLYVPIQSKLDLDRYRGKLNGVIVLSTPPFPIDTQRLGQATPRRSAEELKQLAAAVTQPQRQTRAAQPVNPNRISAEEIITFYKNEGVKAIFECRSGRPGLVRGFARPGTKKDRWSYEQSMESLPIIAITPEHYNRMVRICQRNIEVTVEIEVRNRIGQNVEKANNVLGEIPGTDLGGEIVMIGAHFDTWHASPNASDNTSGCAVVLEAARIIKSLGLRPRRTIRVALWGGEEQGIHGSREYVYKYFGNPHDPKIGIKPGYKKFSTYFNQDYGAGAYRGIFLQGNEFARQLFAEWMKPLKDLGFQTISIQSVGSTDHVPFDRVGLPGFQFIQDRIPGTAGHTNLDFFDTLQIDDLKKNAVIMAVFAFNAATTDGIVPRKTLILRNKPVQKK